VKYPLLLLTAALVVTAACNKDSATTPTTPAAPTRTTTTFTGTVPVRGSDSHSFTTTATGEVDVDLTAATPPDGVIMGLALGTLDASSNCIPLPGGAINAQAGSTPQLTGIFTAGTLCVQVRDLGTDNAPVAYTVTVLHP
jgi:hypothetical protein